MPTVVIRSWTARAATLLVAALCALVIAVVLIPGSPSGPGGPGGGRMAVQVTAWGALLTGAAIVLWWMPELRLETHGLTVRNAWRTWVLPWARIERCAGRWGVEIVLDDGRRVRAAAAPREGGLAAGLRYHAEQREQQADRDSAGRGRGSTAGALASRSRVRGGPVAREELITPGQGTHRVQLDAAGAMDLIELYREQALALASQDSPGAGRSGQARPRGRQHPEPAGRAVRPEADPPQQGAPLARTNWGVVVGTGLTALLLALAILL
ncbi:hypothetical protein [Actinomyces capricornis]|uniref:PH domain-containing protein n=1 Tax=Actinomyces capricornis TaxID=2755559 RepID=A0ABM7U8L0_9ACTO|nr:hypothetical protein [Actinomyces capricornis]BDA63804.1 hypothetical protein MANAM107_06380 [Actinomyces capricornis]